MNYDAFQFVEHIKSKPWLVMLWAIDAHLAALARWPAKSRRHGPAQPGDDSDFRRFLLATRTYLLGEGRVRPLGLPDDQFLLLKPLCEALVKQGRFEDVTLRLFAELDVWNVRALGCDDGARRRERA